jgi:hypothetical protein
MTTLKQRLVRKKNRKLRRLRELYPDLRIKLFYARDFRMLMLKYGKLALIDSLSGTPGQVVPVRDDGPPVAIEPEPPAPEVDLPPVARRSMRQPVPHPELPIATAATGTEARRRDRRRSRGGSAPRR